MKNMRLQQNRKSNVLCVLSTVIFCPHNSLKNVINAPTRVTNATGRRRAEFQNFIFSSIIKFFLLFVSMFSANLFIDEYNQDFYFSMAIQRT